jgi:hypothetical protein
MSNKKEIPQKDLAWHKATLKRIFEIIQSCETLEQLKVASKMLNNYAENYTYTDKDILVLLTDIRGYCDTYEVKLKNNY